MQGRSELAPPPSGRSAVLTWHDAWAVRPATQESDPTLLITAGADRTVAIDGVPPAWVDRVTAWSRGAPVPPEVTGPLIDRLVEVGALTHPGAPTPLRVATATTTSTCTAAEVGAELLSHLTAASLAEATPADLTLVIRTGPEWPAPGPGLHLGIDLTLHHTVQLGPLVIPGVTSCLTCLETRIVNRWGSPHPPPRPQITRRLAAVAALLDVQLELIAGGVSPLVNATTTWDLERATTDHQATYRVPGCPSCDATIPTGRVSLPWAP